MSCLNLDPSELFLCHCIIHQERLCALSLKLNAVIKFFVSAINFIKGRRLNSSQFRELLDELESEYGDLVAKLWKYACTVLQLEGRKKQIWR